jgi:phenylalanyl-tRNA synthetase alpha subunit
MVHRGQRLEFQHLDCETRDGSNCRNADIVRTFNFQTSSHTSSVLPRHSGAWKTSTFKKYNFEAEGIPTNGGALHPLLKVREEIRNIFLEMGCVWSLISLSTE